MKIRLLDIGIMWDRSGIYFVRLSEKYIFADSKGESDEKDFGKVVLDFVRKGEDARIQDKLAG